MSFGIWNASLGIVAVAQASSVAGRGWALVNEFNQLYRWSAANDLEPDYAALIFFRTFCGLGIAKKSILNVCHFWLYDGI